jgi:hypothetical protein
MALPIRYQKSICKGDYLHLFKITAQTSEGLLERCSRCGLEMHFPNDTPNWKYVEYHIRNILRADDALYAHEYA